MRPTLVLLVGILLIGFVSEALAGLLGLTRVLNVNALLDSGNHNGGNGVSSNEVAKNQQFHQRIGWWRRHRRRRLRRIRLRRRRVAANVQPAQLQIENENQ